MDVALGYRFLPKRCQKLPKLSQANSLVSWDNPRLICPRFNCRIVNAVGNQHAIGPTGEVVIKLRTGAAVGTPFPIQHAQTPLGLGVDGKPGISFRFVLLDQVGDVIKLSFPIGRLLRLRPTW
ncbi:MAG: hypothetical protein R3C59_28715 [Planctomycetaceae bacterium]